MSEILLADDDDIGRYVVATMLRRAGFAVREVADGRQAVASAVAEPPALAILDVKMPGMDGFSACRELKSNARTRHIPVLMLSATFLETEAQVEGLETGADVYLTQPVEAPVLAATVRSLLRSRSLEAEVRAAASEWRTTFEAISDAVAVLGPDGTVERANRAFRTLLGDAGEGLAAARERGELALGGRIYSVRFDAVGEAGREVVTLSDVTAARSELDAERKISRTLQQTLLPARLPERADLELDAWHVAAELELIVGGDWYDVIETRRGLWLVMGDVAGHGVAATAQAGQLRHSLRVYAHEGFGLAESMTRLNELLTRSDASRMATLCLVEVSDDEPDSVCVVCAGHPPPLLLPSAGPPRLAEVSPGVVLGVFGTDYAEQRLPFDTGDRLVLYTDGLIERPGEIIDDSLQGLVALADGVEGLAPLRAHLVERLVGATAPRDDVALLLAQRR
jgi:CheY-like chemotaxis protein